MESIFKDLKQALRSFRRSPGFTVAAVAALALGIGANTAIFSVVDAVLLKPLPYPDPDRIVQFMLTAHGQPVLGASVPKFNVWREQTAVFENVAGYALGAAMNLTEGAYPEQIAAMRVTADYFKLFGAPVELGRTFTAEEDSPNAGHFVVLSHGMWQRRFGGDPRMVGRTISLSNQPYIVVGILGPGFVPEAPADAFVPFQFDPNSVDQAHFFEAAGRLRPGVTIDMARAQLQLAATDYRRKFTGSIGPWDGFTVEPLQDSLVGDVRSSLLVLAGAVTLVLLIACANVANLLLVRATDRRREIAVRVALGASRARIVRQLLTESVALTLAGGAFGLALGFGGVRVLLAINPGNIPRIDATGASVTIDWRVLAFTLAISIFTGIVFGLIPAAGASSVDLGLAIRESGGRSGSGRRQNRTRSLLVVGETALALVLLIGAALLIRTFVALRSVDPGFDPRHVLTLEMSFAGTRFNNTPQVAQLVRDAIRRMDALPGIVASGAASSLPLEGASGLPFDIVGRPLPSGPQRVGWTSASPSYFDVFKIPTVRGRGFNDRDDRGAPLVVVINQAMARTFWPNGSPLDDRIVIGKGYGPEFEEPARQIVGIVGDVHDAGLAIGAQPMAYIPMAQVADGMSELFARIRPIDWIVRTRLDPLASRSPIENELRQASAGLPVANVRSMGQIVSQSTARADFNMSLLTIFGAAALLLASIGLYGLVAYSVQQRTQEIGIRMALGAEHRDVRNMIVGQGMGLASIGIALGMAAAFGLTRLLAGFLFGVRQWDPMVFTVVPIVLGGVTLLAVWLPARRATRIDPLDALRYE